MSEQTTPVRTDELAPGDRVWHPFDAVCFTVSHTPRPETGLHFEGEPGLRVTGTSDRGETVHVDVAPGYKWYRGPGVVAPSSAPKAPAPLVVNTADGACWTRRAVTEGGVALYALADVCSCPEFVMATFEELAARGIVGSAFVVPAPVGPEPEPQGPALPWAHVMAPADLHLFLDDLVAAAITRWQTDEDGNGVEDRVTLTLVEQACARWRTPGRGPRSDEEEMDPVEELIGANLSLFEEEQLTARLRLAWESAKRDRRALRARVAELEAERHSTNESLSEAAEQLRRDRDRIAELEAAQGVALRRTVSWRLEVLENDCWWDCGQSVGTAEAARDLLDRERAEKPGTGFRLVCRTTTDTLPAEGSSYPPALPWARLMDHEDLADFLDELAASAITHATAEVALAEVEETCGRWRLIAEAQHAHNTAPGPDTEGDVTPQVERLRTLLAGQREQQAAEGCPRNVIDGNAGGHFFKKGALTDSPVACIYCGTRKSETGDAS